MTSGNRFPRALAAVLILTVVAAMPAGAASAWTLADLMHALAQVKSAKANFTEYKYLKILELPLQSSGTLSYVAPDRLEKNTQFPKPESFVLDQGKITITRDQGREHRTLSLQDYPEFGALVDSMRATLAGDLAALRRFYDIGFDGTAESWHLTLKPREPGLQKMIASITIDGTQALLQTVETREADGDRSVMKIAP